ncbi:MBOAT family O-acyltransferase [Algoriphagus sanaruensis]|uniref:Acyltransferase n=1 Tax=Algoriphagus sanaruensis TaxID=1727163 RepID=A0A142EQU1_9BACT|nr:MBOAT family O-acyltransferase [Algoriphagus sanaruensis]AMQ57496.1 acyltransferase [Algoriphagus sanaruensis]
MLFNSFEFLIFLPLAFLGYWFVFQRNIKLQNAFILLGSYVFYGWWDWRFLGLIIASSAVDYWCGLKLGSVIARRRNSLPRTNVGDDEAISKEPERLLQAGNERAESESLSSLRNDDDTSDIGHRPSDITSVSHLRSTVIKPFQGKNLYLTLSLVFNLGLLGFFKYFNFFIESATDLIHLFGFQAHPSTLNLILPVGISFYTFQTMSYTIDVYRGKMEATKDPIAFFSYVAFFPQLVAGPIERAAHLLPQFLKKREFEYQQGSDGMKLILWGLFKKIVVADNCALVVNPIFENYQTASGLELMMGAVLFAFQIYGDFSGYSDIAIGTAKLFGFDLMTNFRTPYFSRDIAEFWRRWHISLSTWFRDYVYIPLGGSRVSKAKAIRNIFIVFLVSGFWHGANWTFIVWGAIHAALFIPLFIFNKHRTYLNDGRYDGYRGLIPSFREFTQILFTFTLVTLAWIFFRAPSIGDAWGFLSGIFSHDLRAGFQLAPYLLSLVGIAMMLGIEWTFRTEIALSFRSPVLRYGGYIGVVMVILFFGAFFNPQDFIYFQF